MPKHPTGPISHNNGNAILGYALPEGSKQRGFHDNRHDSPDVHRALERPHRISGINFIFRASEMVELGLVPSDVGGFLEYHAQGGAMAPTPSTESTLSDFEGRSTPSYIPREDLI